MIGKYQKFVNGVWVDDVDAKIEGLRASISMMGRYDAKIVRKGEVIDEWECKNVCTYQGLISMLNNTFCGVAAISNWYLGIFQNNYTPVQGDTASSFPASAGEFTGYSGGARPSFTAAQASGTPTINNSAAVATFTMTGSATIYGAFLTSVATPGSGAGVLFSAAQFGSSKNVSAADQLILTYTLNAASA